MEQEHNWKAIMFGAIPVAAAEIFVFNSDIKLGMRWFLLVLGMVLAAAITYFFSKKKHDIFTSPFVVVIVALITHGLRISALF